MKLKIFVGMLLPMFIFAYSGKSAELTTDKSTVKYMRMGGQGKMHFVHVESSSSINRNSYREIAKKICRDERICIVMFWDNISHIPLSLPMTESELNAKVAHYNLNKGTGLDQVLICSVDGC